MLIVPGVGKSAITIQFVTSQFYDQYVSLSPRRSELPAYREGDTIRPSKIRKMVPFLSTVMLFDEVQI